MDKGTPKEENLSLIEFFPTSENSKDFYEISNDYEGKDNDDILNKFSYLTPIPFAKKAVYIPSTPKKKKIENGIEITIEGRNLLDIFEAM